MKDINATILIDLSKSEEEILEKADRSRRKNIRKAEREGLVFVQAQENELNDWYKIYSKVWTLGGLNPEPFASFQKQDYKLYLAKKDSTILGGGIFQEFPDKIVFIAYAPLPEYQNLRVNDFMYWSSIVLAKELGKKQVDLGGWQIKARGHLAGVNRFKEMWGGEITYYYKDYPFYIAIGRKMIRNFPLFRWMWDRLKGRPVVDNKNKES